MKALEDASSDGCVFDDLLLPDPNAVSQPCGQATAELPQFNPDGAPIGGTPIGANVPRRRVEPSPTSDPLRRLSYNESAQRGRGAGGPRWGGLPRGGSARKLVLKATCGAAAIERPAVYDPRLVQRCFQQDTSFLGTSGSASGTRRDNARSLLCVPLRPAQRLMGVVGFDRTVSQPFSERDQLLAEAVANTMSAGIASAQQLLERQQSLFVQTLLSLAEAVDAREASFAGHTQRVTEYTLMLAEEMQATAAEYRLLQMGTPLHDIGKIGIDDAILRKPGRLTPAEFAEIQTHPTRGVALLQPIAELEPILPIVGSHHEHWDGSGYPDGLIGEIIPSLARIVTVADVFDALTCDRPYRKALNVAEAFAYVQRNAGSLFDPQCAQAFVRMRSRVEKAMHDRIANQTTMDRPELEAIRASLCDAGIPRPKRPGSTG